MDAASPEGPFGNDGAHSGLLSSYLDSRAVAAR